jgi:hypothetical protein
MLMGAQRITRVAVSVLALTAGTLALGAGAHADLPSDVVARQVVRDATRHLRTVEAAEAAGYGQFLTCVREPGVGAMGTHWVNGDLVGDTVLDPDRPEAVMFETKRNGDLRLVGVEYIVFHDAWHAQWGADAEAPELFGQMFHLVESPNRYDLPPFYALHVWSPRPNPDGTFQSWNRLVTCEHADGEPI